jgi:hypothetical protein
MSCTHRALSVLQGKLSSALLDSGSGQERKCKTGSIVGFGYIKLELTTVLPVAM